MKTFASKKNRLFLLLVLLIVFSLYSTNNFTDNSLKSFRTKKTEEMKNNIKDQLYSNLNVTSGASNAKIIENVDTQVFDDFTLYKIFTLIKDMEMLFFNLIIILSFYQITLYIKRWIILVYQFRVKLFIMRYLQLKDGKKNAFSFQFSF